MWKHGINLLFYKRVPRERECESKVEVSKNTHKCLAESKIMKSMTCFGFILNAKEVS